MFEKAKFEKRGFMEYRRTLDEKIFETVNFENANSCVFVDTLSLLTVGEEEKPYPSMKLTTVCDTINELNKEDSELKIAIVPVDIEVDGVLEELATFMITSPKRKVNQNDVAALLERIGTVFALCDRKYFNGISKFKHTDAKDLYAIVLDMATYELYKNIAKVTERNVYTILINELLTSECTLDHRNDGYKYIEIQTPIMKSAQICFHEDTRWIDIERALNNAEDKLLQLMIDEELYISDVEEVLEGIGKAYGLGLLIDKYRDSSLQTSNITMLEHFLRNVYTLLEIDKDLVLDHINESVLLYSAFCKLNACIHGVRSNKSLLQNLVNKKRFNKEEVNE